MKKISIAIPTYEMGGKGAGLLGRSFALLVEQTFTDFDVVIADHSNDDEILTLCKIWDNLLDIRYYKNKENRGSASANTNFAIKKSKGQWIKILCQDDYLYKRNSLQIIADNLSDDHAFDWLITSYWHSYDRITVEKLHHPSFNLQLFITNTIGTPSCVAIKNKNDLPEIDENLSYAYDTEWYWRLWNKYGTPLFIYEPTIVNYLHDNSISSGISSNLIDKENRYILDKMGIKYE